jgi:hypothetical protein
MPNFRYVESPGWQYRVLKDPLARRVIKGISDTALKRIITSIPVRDGDYQARFEAGAKTRRSRAANGTASAKIEWSESIWHIIEYGSVNNIAYRPIARGITSTGLRFVGK